jgi:hypothetical protein
MISGTFLRFTQASKTLGGSLRGSLSNNLILPSLWANADRKLIGGNRTCNWPERCRFRIRSEATAGIAHAWEVEHEPEQNTETEEMKRRGDTRIAKILSCSWNVVSEIREQAIRVQFVWREWDAPNICMTGAHDDLTRGKWEGRKPRPREGKTRPLKYRRNEDEIFLTVLSKLPIDVERDTDRGIQRLIVRLKIGGCGESHA